MWEIKYFKSRENMAKWVLKNSSKYIIPTTTKMSKKVTVDHQPIRQYPYFVYIPKMGGSFSCKDLNEVNNILNKYLL